MLQLLKIKLLTWAAHLLRPYIEKDSVNDSLQSCHKMCQFGVAVGVGLQIEGLEFIVIGKNFYAGKYFRLCAIDEYAGQRFSPKIEIGDNVNFQDYCHIGCIEYISIGDGCMFASKVLITDHFHGGAINVDERCMPTERKLVHKPVRIGKNVLVGDGVCIMAGVSLGNNVIIGANAVVTHSFPSNSVIAGVPAKIIRMLNVEGESAQCE